MSILTTSDFTGRYSIPLNPTKTADLTVMISYVQDLYLPKLFGVALYDLFILDLALPVVGDPTAARFVKIFNTFNHQENLEVYSSEGIKEMLKGLTYFHYIRDISRQPTTVGIKQTESANSKNVSALAAGITSRFNQAVNTFQVIQLYMFDFDSANYPEYEGNHQDFSYPF